MISRSQYLATYERQAIRNAPIFRRALMRHLERMIAVAEQNGYQNLEQILLRVTSEDIDKAYQEAYISAGIDYAFQEYDELIPQKRRRRFIIRPDGTRDEVWDKWSAALQAISLDETIPARGKVMTTSAQLFTEIVDEMNLAAASIDEISEAIRAKFRTVVPWRGIMIARTEAISAMNYGAQVAADETGLQYKKTWLTYLDGREREAHRAANEQTVAQHEKFQVGGEQLLFPGDPSASAGNRINCRCQVVRELDE